MSEDLSLRDTRGEVSVEWRIEGFRSLPKTTNYSMDSPIFLLSDAKWFLRIYPNGYKDVEWIALFLRRKCSSSEKHNVSFTIKVRKSDGSTLMSRNREHEFKEVEGCGFCRLLKISEILESNDYVVPDGSLTLLCTARTMAENITETATQTSLSKSIEILQENFKDLFLSGRHGDVTIKVKEQEFQAHRLILVARSPVFSAMFDHDTEEKKTGIVNITDCDPDPFKDFLSFLYTGEVDMVTSSNAIALFKIGDKYDLKDLKAECVRCMAEEMSAETFCDIFLLATMHSELKLLETSTDFFVENVKAILPTSKWQSFIDEHSTMANELFIQLLNKK